MTINCEKINLKKGSKNDTVKELQTILKKLGYYNGLLDGDYGNLTVEAVKKYQKDNGLLQDGIFGPITCKKINQKNTTTTTATTTSNGDKTGRYISKNHHEGKGCNKMGQCNSYCCGPHSIRQSNSKQDIDQFTEAQISSWAGTTTAGTSHNGLETALYEIGRRSGYKIKAEWKNFSDMGNTITERFKNIGRIIEQPNKSVIWHTLYRNKYGHYEIVKEINMNNNTLTVLNSLGNKCNSPAYCGYQENRSFNTMKSYIQGISQKSLLIVTYEK